MSIEELETTVIGVRRHRIEAPTKVTGTAVYAADLAVAVLLHALFWLSPYRHARILSAALSPAPCLWGELPRYS